MQQGQQNPVAGGQMMDPSYITNMMMSGYMMNMMGQLKDSTISFQTICIFLLMVCMADIKKLILWLVEEGKTKIPEWSFLLFSKVKEYACCIFRKKVKEEPYVEPKEIIPGHSVTINLTPNLAMMNALYKYIYANKSGSLENSFSLEANTLQTSTTKVSYSDCSFDLGDSITASLAEPLHFVVKNEDNSLAHMLVDKGGKREKNNIDISGTIIYEILKDKKETQEQLQYEINEYTYEEFATKYNGEVSTLFNNTESFIVDTIKNCIGRKDLLLMLVRLFELYHIKSQKIKTHKEKIIELATICIFYRLFEKQINIQKESDSVYNILYFQNKWHYMKIRFIESFYFGHPLYNGCYYFEDTPTKVSYYKNIFLLPKKETTKEQGIPQLEFSVTAPAHVIEGDANKFLYDRFFHFYTNTIIKNVVDTSKREISVYSIGWVVNEKSEEKENPDYNEWKEMMPKAEDKESSAALVEYMKLKPSKNITVKTYEEKISCTLVNKFYKDLNTLYLREDDKRRLLNIVDKFKNKKHIYDQLGIPHKLGMMFYGAPGTGKTTSIKAIASYLGKDLYFVNLKNVKKNAHLKEIFDHIHNNCNGGVIIFEDIDAMTSVVHKRNSESSSNMTDVLEECNDDLTLSYLLNMLDGSLCKDGTIFAMTTNHIEKIDPALYRKGRVDMTIDFKLCDHYQFDMIYQSIVGRTIPPELLARIPENKYAPCDVIFHVYQYMLDEVDDKKVLEGFMF